MSVGLDSLDVSLGLPAVPEWMSVTKGAFSMFSQGGHTFDPWSLRSCKLNVGMPWIRRAERADRQVPGKLPVYTRLIRHMGVWKAVFHEEQLQLLPDLALNITNTRRIRGQEPGIQVIGQTPASAQTRNRHLRRNLDHTLQKTPAWSEPKGQDGVQAAASLMVADLACDTLRGRHTLLEGHFDGFLRLQLRLSCPNGQRRFDIVFEGRQIGRLERDNSGGHAW
jgi:hypothetical protein